MNFKVLLVIVKSLLVKSIKKIIIQIYLLYKTTDFRDFLKAFDFSNFDCFKII